MEAAMSQLRLFVHQRLFAAAEEILGEVEKTIIVALHEAEVYRDKDEAGSLQYQLAQLPTESAAELPMTNSDVENEDNLDSPLLQEYQAPPTPQESDLTFYNSKADLSNNSWSYCLVEMPEVKEEHEEESETTEVLVSPPEIVKSEEDRSEMHICLEMQPLPSDSSAAGSDEEMVDSRRGEPPKMVKEKEKALRGKTVSDNKKAPAALSNGNSSVKGKKERSFCHLCGKGFYYIAALKKHEKTHKKCTSCVLCGMKYDSRKELVHHLKTKHNKSFFCDVCGKTFSYSRSFQSHKNTHKATNELVCKATNELVCKATNELVCKATNELVCQECGKTFQRRDHLTVHVRTHSGEKPYACDVCGKSFSQSQNLRIHKRSHSGERPYQCSECDRSFTTSTQCKAHMRLHSEGKLYPCDVCGKTFFSSYCLKTHKITHNATNKYACQECGRTFHRCDSLTVHLRTHSGEKPYACDICGKSFTQSQSLTIHKRSHSGERPYHCHYHPECDRSFTTSTQCKMHMRLHSGENPKQFTQAADGMFW